MSTDTNSELQDFNLQGGEEEPGEYDIDKMSEGELLVLHGKIESRLSGLTLDELDLTRETLVQLQKAKHLQSEASKRGANVPMNQQAQVQNSIANIITTLAKVQMELYTSERYKRIQSAVVKVVKELPKESQDWFFELLERELGEVERSLAAEGVGYRQDAAEVAA